MLEALRVEQSNLTWGIESTNYRAYSVTLVLLRHNWPRYCIVRIFYMKSHHNLLLTAVIETFTTYKIK